MLTPKSEPWVGTWRPHRPKGPIAALYGSPGPKYALPPLTGHSKQDPTKYTAPVFSFGRRHALPKSDCSPGPKYRIPSNITRFGRDGTPAFSHCSRPKELVPFQTPGPGKYSLEKSEKVVFCCAPAFSLSGRHKEFSSSQTPGPAAYSLPPVLGPKTVVTTGAPAYSLVGRSKTGVFAEDLTKYPGIAAYKVVDPNIYKQKPPQFSIAGRNFAPSGTAKTPGPGTYSPEKVTLTRSQAPSFSFGIRHSEYMIPFFPCITE